MRIRLHGSGGNIAWQQIRICIASSARSSSPSSLPYLRVRANIFFSIRSKKRQSGHENSGIEFVLGKQPSSADFFFHATRNSADSISRSAIRKCSLSDSYAFLIYYFCEILKGKRFTYACCLSIPSCLFTSRFSFDSLDSYFLNYSGLCKR